MNIKINKDKLLTLINKAERVSVKNGTLPILSSILFDIKEEKLIVSSTNLDIGFTSKIKIPTEANIKFAVEGFLINQFVNNLPKTDDIIELELEENTLKIKTKSTSVNIKTQNPEEFPAIPEIKSSKTVKINSKIFLNGLKSVWYSASLSNIKPELSSVLIYQEDNSLVFVATDSYRLAEKRLKIGKIDEFENILIPYKNVVEIIKIIEDLDEELELVIEEDQIALKTENMTIVSRIVNGAFPDYKQIIPKEFKTKVTVLKQDFIQQLKINNLFSDNFNKITIETEDGKIKTLSENQEKGKLLNEITAKIEGNNIKAKFNHKYISECFNSIDSDTIVLEFIDTNKPLIIRGLKDNTFTYLVMPLNK